MTTLGTCRCAQQDVPCQSTATAEDLLCDACRPGDCVEIHVNDQPVEFHIGQAEARQWIREIVT